MNKNLMVKQVEVNNLLVEGLEAIQEIIEAKHDKQYNKRIVDAMSEALLGKSEFLRGWKREGYGDKYDYFEVMTNDRNVQNERGNWDYVKDYTIQVQISYIEGSKNKIDAPKTLETIKNVIEGRKSSNEKLLGNLNEYDALLEEKRRLQRLIEEHNSKISFYMGDLKVNYR